MHGNPTVTASVTMLMVQSSRFVTAVHILTLLATEKDQSMTSDYVASSVNTNPVVIRRLLRKLAEAGLVSSCPGSAGGSRLARPAREITLQDVFAAVESGELFGGASQEPSERCPVGRHIGDVLHPRLRAAETAAAGSLRKTSIADLMAEVRKKA
jgi:Rrf2 family protein